LHYLFNISGPSTDHSCWVHSHSSLWSAGLAIPVYVAFFTMPSISSRPLIRHMLSSAVIKLPLGFIYDRFLLAKTRRSPFVRQASWFEDIVIRCVRYAFTYIPASIGRIFFSKPVSLPFLRFRMLRHGYIHSPTHWHEVHHVRSDLLH
jgi:hypothetical protein